MYLCMHTHVNPIPMLGMRECRAAGQEDGAAESWFRNHKVMDKDREWPLFHLAYAAPLSSGICGPSFIWHICRLTRVCRDCCACDFMRRIRACMHPQHMGWLRYTQSDSKVDMTCAAYGIVERAEANIMEAKKLNMTYMDYVSTYLQQVRRPSGD